MHAYMFYQTEFKLYFVYYIDQFIFHLFALYSIEFATFFICLECLKLKLIHHACVIFFPFSQTLLISNICLTFSIILCQRALFIICIQHVALYSDYCFHSDSLLKFKTTWILVDNYFIVRHIFYYYSRQNYWLEAQESCRNNFFLKGQHCFSYAGVCGFLFNVQDE